MSSQTPNLNLVLPVGTEHVSRQIINDNNTKIDTAVGTNSQAIANVDGKITTEPVQTIPYRTGVFYGAVAQTIGGVTIPSYCIYDMHIRGNDGTGTAVHVTDGKMYSIYGYDGAWVSAVEISQNLFLIERQAVNFTNGKATVNGKTNYELVNVHAYARPDTENNSYNVLMFQKNTSGNYVLKNANETLTSSVYLFFLWVKTY